MPRFRYSAKHGDLIGAHISTKGGVHTVFERASAINASAIALYARKGFQPNGEVSALPPPREHIREHQRELKISR